MATIGINTKLNFMNELIKRVTGYDFDRPLATSYITDGTKPNPVKLGELEKTTLRERKENDQVESDGKTAIQLVTTHQVLGLTVKDTIKVDLKTGQVTDQRICQYPATATQVYRQSVQPTYQALCGTTSFRVLGYFKPDAVIALQCDLSSTLPTEIGGLNGGKREVDPQACYKKAPPVAKR